MGEFPGVAASEARLIGGRGWKVHSFIRHARAQDLDEPLLEVVAERRVGDPVHYGIVDDGRLGEDNRSGRDPWGDQFDVPEDGDEADDRVRDPGDQEQDDEDKDDLGHPELCAFSRFPLGFLRRLQCLEHLPSTKTENVQQRYD